MAESKASSIDFGVLIAFIAPGFLALVALSWSSPTVKEWLTSAGEKEQNVGVFLFSSLAALALGLAVSGLRALVVDPLFYWKWLLKRFAVSEPDISWASLTPDEMTKVIVIRDNYFRYYQFYSNMAVALALWVGVRALGGAYSAVPWFHVALHVLGIGVLLASARGSLKRYSDALLQLKGVNE